MHKIITVQLKKKKVENRVPYGYSDVADGGPIGIPEPTSVVLIYAKILKQHNNNHRISLVFKCRSVECGGRGCENVIAALSYFRCVPKIEICRFRINISTVTVSLPPRFDPILIIRLISNQYLTYWVGRAALSTNKFRESLTGVPAVFRS